MALFDQPIKPITALVDAQYQQHGVPGVVQPCPPHIRFFQ